MRILGIDCGTEHTGYGLIESDGRSHRMIAAGCIRTLPKEPLEIRLLTIALDAGADDLRDDGESWEVISPPEAHDTVLQAIQTAGIPTVSAEVAMVPKNLMRLEGNQAKSMLRLNDVLEDNEDVQYVFSNFDVDEKELEAMA